MLLGAQMTIYMGWVGMGWDSSMVTIPAFLIKRKWNYYLLMFFFVCFLQKKVKRIEKTVYMVRSDNENYLMHIFFRWACQTFSMGNNIKSFVFKSQIKDMCSYIQKNMFSYFRFWLKKWTDEGFLPFLGFNVQRNI